MTGQSSAGPITAGGMSAGSITSQPFGSSITASQPVDSIAMWSTSNHSRNNIC